MAILQRIRQRIMDKQYYTSLHNIVEDVEAAVCSECGERYLHATTLDTIDQLLSKEHTVKANLNVEVVSLEAHGLTSH